MASSKRTGFGTTSASQQGWPEADLLHQTRMDNRVLIGLGRCGEARLYCATAAFGEWAGPDWLVKVYRIIPTEDADSDPVARDRPAIELAANIELLKAESIERIHNFFVFNEYQVMCFMDRSSYAPLEKTINQGRLLTLTNALFIIEQLTWALRAIHQRQILHRNINPWSVLVSWISDGWATAMLTDLSCARFLAGEHAALVSDPVGGRGGYQAPEQHGAGDHDFAADVYAMGRLIYDILAGQRLPECIFTRRPPHLSQIRGDVIPEFADVVQRCHAYDPGVRPKANELLGWARRASNACQGGKLIAPEETEALLRRIWA